METTFHPFAELFDQLGLPSDDASIREFIATHSPVPPELRLAEAPFWTDAQSRLLKEAITQDADWAEVVDHLDASMRKD